MENKRILIGICGSFCNHQAVLKEIKKLSAHNDVQIVVTDNVNTLSTRFFERDVFVKELVDCTHHPIINSIVEAEKVGPNNNFDIMAITPLTATICGKFANGIYDSPVALAAKAMIRNQKNVVIGFASNDGLGLSGPNLMHLMSTKHIYAIPFAQDAPFKKPYSIVAKWELLEETLDKAYENEQIQPILLSYQELSA